MNVDDFPDGFPDGFLRNLGALRSTYVYQLTTCTISLAATKSWRGAEQAAAANGPTEATTMKKNPNPPRSQAPGPWSKHLHA